MADSTSPAQALVPLDPAAWGGAAPADLVRMYNHRLADDHATPHAVMLMTELYQESAFGLAHELMQLLGPTDSLLDVGCGFGCLLQFLREKGWAGQYTGVDLVEGFVQRARVRFANDALAEFKVADFLTADLPRHDVCVGTNIFGIAPGVGVEFMQTIAAKALSIATKGVVLTFNSKDRQVFPLKTKAYQMADVLEMVLALSPAGSVHHRCTPCAGGHYAMGGALIRVH